MKGTLVWAPHLRSTPEPPSLPPRFEWRSLSGGWLCVMILVDGPIFDRVAVSLLIMWSGYDDGGVSSLVACSPCSLATSAMVSNEPRTCLYPVSAVITAA
jgi:hypothetical protein